MTEPSIPSTEHARNARIELVDGHFVASNAVVVGACIIGEDVNIWYGCVLRGDDASITIGRGTNLQDMTMVHPDPDKPLTIGEDVTIGHRALIHCVEVGDRSLIGMGAILMEDVVVGEESLVAAGSVVFTVPGRIVRETTEEERSGIVRASVKYVENARAFHARYR